MPTGLIVLALLSGVALMLAQSELRQVTASFAVLIHCVALAGYLASLETLRGEVRDLRRQIRLLATRDDADDTEE